MNAEGTVAEVLAGAARFAVVCGERDEVLATVGDAVGSMMGYFTELIERRRHEPGDDTVSHLVAAGVGAIFRAPFAGALFAATHDLRQQPGGAVWARIGFHCLLAVPQHLRGMPGQLRARIELAPARTGEGQVDPHLGGP